MPTGHGPPSRISATLSPSSAATCAAVVGLTRPERLADGAAIGRPAARSSVCATGCAGARSATVSSPALASSERPLSARRGSTRLSGPGQKWRAARRPRSSNSASASASARPGTCTISGLKRGRSLAAKMRATASSLVASPPSPYTVSVGKATSSPARIRRAARSIASSLAGTRLSRHGPRDHRARGTRGMISVGQGSGISPTGTSISEGPRRFKAALSSRRSASGLVARTPAMP